MEEKKVPTPPSQMRKMPPPPPKPKTTPATPVAPQTEKVAVKAPEEKVVTQEVAPKTEPKVQETKPDKTKKIKKESAQEEENLDNIGLVDVRQTKKVDTKAMIYYVGIFVSLALMAVIIFLLLK